MDGILIWFIVQAALVPVGFVFVGWANKRWPEPPFDWEADAREFKAKWGCTRQQYYNHGEDQRIYFGWP
jgi:hypothetical protein